VIGPYLARRLGQSLFILLGITLVTYLLLYLLPADPVRQFTRGNAPPEVVESIRRQLGLDLPLWQQYLRYLGRLLHGDLGRSYIQKTEVATLTLARLPATPQLMAGAIVVELLIGLTVGITAAAHRGRDHGRDPGQRDLPGGGRDAAPGPVHGRRHGREPGALRGLGAAGPAEPAGGHRPGGAVPRLGRGPVHHRGALEVDGGRCV
jgi:hypothetical protein